MIVDEVEFSYCEGWDADLRDAAGPLSTERARRLDEAGSQYAVLLRVAGRPAAIAEIAWSAGYCSVWSVDGQGRRDSQAVWLLLEDDRLFLRRERSWRYDVPERPEFHGEAARRELTVDPDGRTLSVEEPRGDAGGSTHAADRIPADARWRRVPAFGDWAVLAETLGRRDGWEVAPRVVLRDVSPAEDGGLPGGPLPWRPPRPLRPEGVDRMFRHGARYRLRTAEEEGEAREVAIEVEEAGTVRLPSGRVVAADPSSMEFGEKPLTTAVAPGAYPLLLARVRFADEPGHARVAAARLVIADRSAATWELGVRDGEDPRLLDDGEFYGFGVDAGLGCFVDATAAEALGGLVWEDWDDWTGGPEQRPAELTDPATGANLLAFGTGWGDGSYPVWVGRDRDGAVVGLVADLLVLHSAEPLG
ncbi:DUF4241 domain-containing protein [Actinomadura parmotrematis]|uniref:DUF4241 domain-containing protein n=1 Tax=Actinomadura parmotrematis TaxID=2864039 RepID=A0ABS7G7K4_9ACTN|nr:DUF4241 domain-containing protein [Actinomadura parmotrematis]MBW8487613.1 DUF4241 domain-containing protein [Actinomadura parmotrematis]